MSSSITKIKNTINRPITTSMGMFDLLKGVAMFFIVFAHNRSVFPELAIAMLSSYSENGAIKFLPTIFESAFWVRICFAIIGSPMVALMPALFIVTGYSSRKRKIGKCFSMNAKDLIKPYLVTTIVTLIFNVCLHYCFFRYLKGAIKETAMVFGGMILGMTQTVPVGDYWLYANGPIWFVLALFWSIVIFNVLLNKFSDEKLPYYAFGISVLGWVLSFFKYTPFCLSQGMVGVIYVYMGYHLIKTKALISAHDKKTLVKYALLVILPNLVLTFFGCITEMADNVYTLGPVVYVENGLLGIGCLYVLLRTDSLFKGKISGYLRYVGRYSFYFMCIHTVEMIAIPWYTFADRFNNHQVLGFFVIYFIRLVINLIGLVIVVKLIQLKREHSLVGKQ